MQVRRQGVVALERQEIPSAQDGEASFDPSRLVTESIFALLLPHTPSRPCKGFWQQREWEGGPRPHLLASFLACRKRRQCALPKGAKGDDVGSSGKT